MAEKAGGGGENEKRVQGKPNNSSTLVEVAWGEKADVDLQWALCDTGRKHKR